MATSSGPVATLALDGMARQVFGRAAHGNMVAPFSTDLTDFLTQRKPGELPSWIVTFDGDRAHTPIRLPANL